MEDGQKKSRKRSGGKKEPPKTFQIYLDENLCNCQLIIDVLHHNEIKIHSHLAHFSPGTPDHVWLQFVGSKKLQLLTTDKRLRYNDIERDALETYSVQSFEFTCNNKGAKAMADALSSALPKMIKLKRSRRKCFVASIGPSGQVKVVWDSKWKKRRKKSAHKSK